MVPPRKGSGTTTFDHVETREELISEEAARRAVKKVFAILGVDIDDPKEVEEFRKDLRFAADMRQYTKKGFMVFFTAIIGLAATAAWVFIFKRNV